MYFLIGEKQNVMINLHEGAQWLSGRVLDSRPRGRGFKPHRHHWVVSLSRNINPSLVLVQPRKTHPFITERLLMVCKESNQTNKINLHDRGGSGISGKGVHIYKGVGVRFADFISFSLNIS